MMTFRLVLSVSSAFALFAITALTTAPSAHADEHDRYVDQNFGFSFSKPRFIPSEEKDVTTVAVTLAGSPDGLFAPNLNVIIQNIETNLDAFAELQLQELQSIGWEVVEQSRRRVGGAPALRTRARGSLRGMEVEFLAVAIIQKEKKVVVLTCTATKEQFPLYQAEFERVASSFIVDKKSR